VHEKPTYSVEKAKVEEKLKEIFSSKSAQTPLFSWILSF